MPVLYTVVPALSRLDRGAIYPDIRFARSIAIAENDKKFIKAILAVALPNRLDHQFADKNVILKMCKDNDVYIRSQ
jgi:hypothetical protein